jgi:zinc transporter ZupT
MVYGVLIHKIPIAIVITGFLFQSDFSNLKKVVFLVVFASMTPLGTFISNNASFVTEYLQYINAIVIGIFFHIATIILFESSEGHKFNLTKLLSIILGIAVAYFI